MTQINNSTSKQQFAFSKADRFGRTRHHTIAFAYEAPNYFGRKSGPVGRGFGASADRFGYEEKMRLRRVAVGKIDGPSGSSIDNVK